MTGVDPRAVGTEIRLGRENTRTKARRYLTEGRLVVRSVSLTSISAQCRGTGEIYDLGYDEGPGWWCTCPTCPARGECAHLLALQTVTIRPSWFDQETDR